MADRVRDAHGAGTGAGSSPRAGGRLLAELSAFGVVGLIGYVVDVAVFNILLYAGDPGLLADKPITAKIASTAIATVVTFIGHRELTWGHQRGRRTHRLHREMLLFVLFNVIGMGIAVACLWFSHYVLRLESALADNLSANVVGLALGTAFRFWAYRTFVFTGSARPAASRDTSSDA